MSARTAIEWTDAVWNPVRGCSLVSAGCANCYAMKQAHRFSGEGMPYEGLTEFGPQGPRWTGKIELVPEVLEKPLQWKKPRRIFVNSMSDLFHEDVPQAMVVYSTAIMIAAYWHTFQILTKRPQRMTRLMNDVKVRDAIAVKAAEHINHLRGPHSLAATRNLAAWNAGAAANVWLGVSVENDTMANDRIPMLLETPAAVRFVSAEPLLGPIGLGYHLWRYAPPPTVRRDPSLDWVIVGGESGPGARPCDVAWIRSIVRQCQAAGVPVFVKQLGKYIVDRNDAGFEGDEQTSWPMDTDVDDPTNEWHWQGAAIRIRLSDHKGGDPAEWPADLRVREWPQ